MSKKLFLCGLKRCKRQSKCIGLRLSWLDSMCISISIGWVADYWFDTDEIFVRFRSESKLTTSISSIDCNLSYLRKRNSDWSDIVNLDCILSRESHCNHLRSKLIVITECDILFLVDWYTVVSVMTWGAEKWLTVRIVYDKL